VGLEGALRIGLYVADGHVAGVRVSSTRPDVARSLLKGRTRVELSAAVPLLYSICGRSQAAASELACAAAAGETIDSDTLARRSTAVSAEMVREYAWRTLLDWPQWIGEKASDDAAAAARGSLAFQFDAASPAGTSGMAHAIALAAFGTAAEEWLALRTLPELERWIDTGSTASARFVRRARDDDAATGAWRDRPAPEVPLLDGEHHATWIGTLSAAADADPAFERHPVWRGAPAETGALARLQSDPLISAFAGRCASRVPARFVARLRELALLLAGRATAQVGARSLPGASGIAWVENARGLLIHKARLDQGRIGDYRIVAPTEWNFHPQGALAAALSGNPAVDLDAAKRHAARCVNSLDPCVAFSIEFDNA
jgi:hypothetical protein